MPTIFTKIVNGEIPSYKVAESDKYYAFLDINPVVRGHTLVIPKQEVDYFFDLDDDEICGIMIFAKKIANRLKENIPCSRVAIVVLGLEVPHAHIHLLPINNENEINFQKKIVLSQQEFEKIQTAVRID